MIGIDAVYVDRLRSVLERAPEIEARLFTSGESEYCRGRGDPVLHFAGTLAAKEAVIKAHRLGTLAAWGRRVEIVRDEGGAPWARIRGTGVPIHLSISHDGPVAVAVAVALELARRDGSAGQRAVDDSGDSDREGVRRRPNEQLARYIAYGRRHHDPHDPRRSQLRDAQVMVPGSDFP